MSRKYSSQNQSRYFSLALIMLFSASTFFVPLSMAIASPTGFDVLEAEFVAGGNDYNLNVTLERTKPTAENIIGTLQLPEDYTEENFTLIDPEQSWGTMTKNEIKSLVYETDTLGDTIYPLIIILNLTYTQNGQQKNEILTLEPTWSGGGDVQPEILAIPFLWDFYVDDVDKGSGVVLKTWVRYDPGRFGSGHYHWHQLKWYFTSPSDYSDFSFWTPKKNFNTIIPKGTTALKQYTVGPFIDSDDGGTDYDYALNEGDFDITSVWVRGTDPTVWQDQDDPNSMGCVVPPASSCFKDGEFRVDQPSGTHHVFQVVLYDDYFITHVIDNFTEFTSVSDFMDDTVGYENYHYGTWETDYSSMFNQSYHYPIIYNWDYDPGEEEPFNWTRDHMNETARDLLGLASGWDSSNNVGTSTDNHGFDQLMFLSGRPPSQWDLGTVYGQSPVWPGTCNYFLTMDDYTDPTYDSWFDYPRLVLHEMGHNYGVSYHAEIPNKYMSAERMGYGIWITSNTWNNYTRSLFDGCSGC